MSAHYIETFTGNCPLHNVQAELTIKCTEISRIGDSKPGLKPFTFTCDVSNNCDEGFACEVFQHFCNTLR